MKSNTDRPEASPSSDNEQAEQRMRRALGLKASGGDHAGGTHQPRAEQPAWTGHGSLQPKRRFVRDGEVPVVVLQGRREAGGHDPSLSGRLATTEAALQAEQEARKTADKALADALARVLDLRTELGHATLTTEETRRALRPHGVETPRRGDRPCRDPCGARAFSGRARIDGGNAASVADRTCHRQTRTREASARPPAEAGQGAEAGEMVDQADHRVI